MTKYEKEQFEQWDRDISLWFDMSFDILQRLYEKYLRLNGSRSCAPEDFIFEIVNCTKVPEMERVSDLRKYLFCIRAEAKYVSSFDILHILEKVAP